MCFCALQILSPGHPISLFRLVSVATLYACVCVLQVLIRRRSWRLQFRAALWTAFTVSPCSSVFLQHCNTLSLSPGLWALSMQSMIEESLGLLQG